MPRAGSIPDTLRARAKLSVERATTPQPPGRMRLRLLIGLSLSVTVGPGFVLATSPAMTSPHRRPALQRVPERRQPPALLSERARRQPLRDCHAASIKAGSALRRCHAAG